MCSPYKLIILSLCLLIGAGGTVPCDYTLQHLIEDFAIRDCLFFLAGTDLGQQVTYLTFFTSNNCNSLNTNGAVRVQVLCGVLTEKRDLSRLQQLFSKIKGKLGLLEGRVCL